MIVHADHLTLRLPSVVAGRPALVHAATDVSLTLTPGRLHALVGESGAGKSVLASTLTGLVPPRTRVQGRLEVAGRDVTAALGRPRHPLWSELRGRVVGSVPASPATSFTPTRTVGAQVAETVASLGGCRSVAELAASARLPEWALAAYPHELSGGLVARAALAGALAGQPQVLVADEPTSALDPDLSDDVLALLRSLADDGVAVLLITHDVGRLSAGRWADDVSVMYAGRIVEHGPASRVWDAPADAYTRALLAALPRNGLHTAPGDPPALTDLPDGVRFEDRLTGGAA